MTQEPHAGAEPQPQPAPEALPEREKTLGENAFIKLVQRPRIMLILLGCWSLLAFFTQLFVNSGVFVEHHGSGDISLDGALGGLALGWEGIPLSVLYFYSLRDPVQLQRVFWLALIHMLSLVSADLYLWLARGAYSFESVIIPLAGSGGLATLVFLHLFRPRHSHDMLPE